ncbi:CBS domain-containing protein [Bradyrhizobium sp.]|uniref:CBS domain-containing protein n=1 Tax=Bradyrhizobium sp. TaxID=376 RepID=UPI002D6869DB|nr:CBS domain-containing protein [Bradyrhizobium sp.]HZR72474.1 CBS domain-containing protein [Bradyrhizobium sp.]
MRARQIMTRKVVSVTPEQTILEAVNLMLRNHVSGLPVVDRAGAVVGIVSEADFLRRTEIGTPRKHNRLLSFIFGHGPAADDYVRERGRKISEVMTPSPITVGEDAPLSDIVSLMERHRIKRVPVVRDDKLVGIVSRSNLIQAVASLSRDVPDPTADDDHIRERIIAEIEKHDWCPIDLNVVVRDGIVHLSGVLTSERYRQAVIVAAENVQGVVKVHDHLFWMDLVTGNHLESPEDEEWARAG